MISLYLILSIESEYYINKEGLDKNPPPYKIQYPKKNQDKDRSLACCNYYTIL